MPAAEPAVAVVRPTAVEVTIMILFSLSVPIQLLQPGGTLPLPMVALVGRSREADGRVEITADAAIPSPGGLLYFRKAVVVGLAPSAVVASQEIVLPPRPND